MTSETTPRTPSVPLWVGTVPLWIGTFPAAGLGTEPDRGEGVWRVDVDAATGAFTAPVQVVTAPSPSFLALHPSGRTLYAASETDTGVAVVLAVDAARESLEPVTSVPTGGPSPCHVSATPDTVWLANYGGGSVARFPVDEDGLPLATSSVDQHEGSGPDADRQGGPHAHFVAPVGDEVWSADLGTDQLVRYTPDGAVIGAVQMPAGTGPRHFVHVPGAVLVVGELDPAVFVVSLGDEESAEPTVTHTYPLGSATSEPRPYPSHVALSQDGSRLYVAVRGADTIVAYAVETSGTEVSLRALAESPIGGAWPRHFAVVAGPTADDDGDLVVVAQQNGDELTSLRVDRVTGRARVLGSVSLPAPGCVLVDSVEG
ncbi:lactonase family protein [Paraoerskovia marina]|uniref:lactonase family protein n=1 Tax=Paraoerskovia marina TaxID=545619 RepID=UPI0006942B5B|nr:beta-propeller fold lactonase family protein [Paraoerskovia marina]